MKEDSDEKSIKTLLSELKGAIRRRDMKAFCELEEKINAKFAQKNIPPSFKKIPSSFIDLVLAENLLNSAAANAFYACIAYLLEKYKDKLTQAGARIDESTLKLVIEIYKGDQGVLDFITFLLERATNTDRNRLLRFAAVNSDDPELVKKFISGNNEDRNALSEALNDIFSTADNSRVIRKNAVINLLLKAGADPNWLPGPGRVESTAVFMAFGLMNKEVLVNFILAGAELPHFTSFTKELANRNPEFKQFMKELALLKRNAQLMGLSLRDIPEPGREAEFFSKMPVELQVKIASHTTNPQIIPESEVKKIARKAIEDIKKPENHFKSIKIKATKGDATAQNFLGKIYENGSQHFNVNKNEARAVELYRLAARQHHPDAQRNLARMYAEGKGGLPKSAEMEKVWRKRADECENYQRQLKSEHKENPSLDEQRQIKEEENHQPNIRQKR